MVSELFNPLGRACPLDLLLVLIAHLLKKNLRLYTLGKLGKLVELGVTFDSTGEQSHLKLYIQRTDRLYSVSLICTEYDYEVQYKRAFPAVLIGHEGSDDGDQQYEQ
jgi:hypothetical protein